MRDVLPFVLIPFVFWGVRFALIRRRDYSGLKRATLIIGLSAFFLTELGRSLCRPFIYANELNDWIVADTVGNSFGTVSAIFVLLTIVGRGTRRDWRVIGMVVAGLAAYEMLNLAGDHPFDLNDVLATLLFGGLSALAYGRLLAVHGKEVAR